MLIRYPTVGEIIDIHERILKRFGGSKGIADIGAIYLIVDLATERFSFIEKDSVIKKSALFLYELTTRHAFLDGNKRTALAVCAAFLEFNGIRLVYTVDEGERISLEIASGQRSMNQVEKWIKRHARLSG